jgi:peptidoglycan/xylan/chitin deacetylase (PgdA/CDA1 family)
MKQHAPVNPANTLSNFTPGMISRYLPCKKTHLGFLVLLFAVIAALAFLFAKPLYPIFKYEYYLFEMQRNSGPAKGIPTLVYHCVDKNRFGDPEMFISPGLFEEQMKYLHDSGYTPITFEQLAAPYKITKPILITFDDGYENNYTYAYPVLKKYHFHATVFLTVNSLNHNRFLTTEELDSMKGLIDYGSHAVHHRNLARLPKARQEAEIRDSKLRLESLLHIKVSVFSYPYGAYNRNTLKLTKKYYSYAVATSNLKSGRTSASYEIKRVQVDNTLSMKMFRHIVQYGRH